MKLTIILIIISVIGISTVYAVQDNVNELNELHEEIRTVADKYDPNDTKIDKALREDYNYMKSLEKSKNWLNNEDDCDKLIDNFVRNTGWTIREMIADKIVRLCL